MQDITFALQKSRKSSNRKAFSGSAPGEISHPAFQQIIQNIVHNAMSQRLQILQEMHAKSPDDSFTLFAIAKEYEGLGQADQALAFYLMLRDKDPDYVGLYYHLGKLYEKTVQPELALQAYRSGMEVAKKQGDNHAWSELNAAKMELTDDDDDF